ncbi:MAG TPA: hypothetical protein VK919_06785 [Solirubrobacterales bacterium]|nr:hypothetical protein [Solirubrobacterales bacterium]
MATKVAASTALRGIDRGLRGGGPSGVIARSVTTSRLAHNPPWE